MLLKALLILHLDSIGGRAALLVRIASASAFALSNSCWLMMPFWSSRLRTGSEGSAAKTGAQLRMLMQAAAKISRFEIEERWCRFLRASAQKCGVSVFGCRI